MTSGGSFTVYFDYEAIKDNLACKIDLNAYFIEKVIGNTAVDTLDIGTVHFPTGKIFACDLLRLGRWGSVYFGYDAQGKVCGVYIHFIDIAESYDA